MGDQADKFSLGSGGSICLDARCPQVFRMYQLAVMVMSPAILTALNSAARAAKHRLGRSIVFCHGGENEETIRSIHVANPTSISCSQPGTVQTVGT